jgi:type IV secretion system protein VirD4
LSRARQTGNVTTYGSARWATLRNVATAGLMGDCGIFLGALGHDYQ